MADKFPSQPEISELPRRRFMRQAAAATMTCFSPSLLSGRQAMPSDAASASNHSGATEADAMEQALERMAGLALLSNHGPMAAEALIALGRSQQVAAWVEGYKRRFTASYPAAREAVTRANWREALGDARREADWVEFFRRELKEAAWPQVVGQWASALAPGLAAAAAHGLLRTAHAVRSLGAKETELRHRELAEGLGYWAAHYQRLPEALPDAPGGKPGKLKPAEALVHVPHLPDEKRIRGSIVTGLSSLNQLPSFAPVADLIALPAEAAPFLSELTETFATVYVRNVHSRNAIALVHAVTGTTALRSLLPHLSPSATRGAQRYGWQLAAAIYAVYGAGSTNPLPAAKEIKRDDLIDRAVATEDEHAIKFTEACLREYALNPKPVYLQAARDAVERFS
ncbi:MAG: questin oxidase family protein [Blastocatellia bacterium]